MNASKAKNFHHMDCLKKNLLLAFALTFTLSLMAVPARRGIWRMLTLVDGTQVRAQLVGDEYAHYYRSADGNAYLYDETADAYRKTEPTTLRQQGMRRRTLAGTAARQALVADKATATQAMTGNKRALIILAEFQDQKFADGDDLARYRRIANEEGFSEGRFKGSLRDYFKAQSDGQFVLDFDVAGPVTLSNSVSYYGANDRYGYDLRPETMVAEACQAVDDEVDFSAYDWDGDGEVEQVFVIYAGLGEANGGEETTIWPHKYNLRYANKDLTLDGVYIDTYACGAELAPIWSYNWTTEEFELSGTTIDGIGTVCHEFSHCLGYPDTYDLDYEGRFGMGSWDLMCSGNYNDDGFCPAGYNAYEKMMAGWLSPTELADEDTEVDALKALSEGGGAYIIYNSDHRDEYYLIENRQRTAWDASLPAAGMIVTHVDYDKDCWDNNVVNTPGTYTTGMGYTTNFTNDHQRLTIVHADNDDDSQYWDSGNLYYNKTTEAGDPYPYNGNNALTANSTPAAKVYNAHTDGSLYLGRGITDITQHEDGTISFHYIASSQPALTPVGEVLHESFDQCNGTGGNDGQWSGSIATKSLQPDVTGWNGSKMYGGDRCARFGTSSVRGEVTSPTFQLNGKATLTFRAAPWGSDGTNLEVYLGSTRIGSYTMAKEKWTDYTVDITGSGDCRLIFSPDQRFFLDEVRIYVDNGGSTAIDNSVHAPTRRHDGKVYSLQGQCIGTNLGKLPKGIYIVNGKKVIK